MKQSNKITEITDLLELLKFKNVIDPAKIAALYVRLSRDDNLDGDSYSIINQKKLLIEIAKGKRYTRIKKLTPQILREFVDKIIVHHRERVDGVDEQKIEIIYNCVGRINIPDIPKIPQQEIVLQTRKGVAISYSKSQKTA